MKTKAELAAAIEAAFIEGFAVGTAECESGYPGPPEDEAKLFWPTSQARAAADAILNGVPEKDES